MIHLECRQERAKRAEANQNDGGVRPKRGVWTQEVVAGGYLVDMGVDHKVLYMG